MIDDAELAQRLRDRDLLAPATLDEAHQLQDQTGHSLYQTLAHHELLDERKLVEVASEILNVASVNLEDIELEEKAVDMLPGKIAVRTQTLPLETEEDDGTERLVLGMSDPIDMFAMDEVADFTGIDIRPVLVGPRQLAETLEEVYGDELEELEDAASEADADSPEAENVRETVEMDPISAVAVSALRASGDGDDEGNPHERETLPRPEPVDESNFQTESSDTSPGLPGTSSPLPPLDDDSNEIGRVEVAQMRVPADEHPDRAKKASGADPDGAEGTIDTDRSDAADERAGGDGEPDAPEETSNSDSRLQDLMSRLKGGKDKADGKRLGARIVEALPEMDTEDAQRLAEASASQIVGATVVALLEQGVISVEDLIGALES